MLRNFYGMRGGGGADKAYAPESPGWLSRSEIAATKSSRTSASAAKRGQSRTALLTSSRTARALRSRMFAKRAQERMSSSVMPMRFPFSRGERPLAAPVHEIRDVLHVVVAVPRQHVERHAPKELLVGTRIVHDAAGDTKRLFIRICGEGSIPASWNSLSYAKDAQGSPSTREATPIRRPHSNTSTASLMRSPILLPPRISCARALAMYVLQECLAATTALQVTASRIRLSGSMHRRRRKKHQFLRRPPPFQASQACAWTRLHAVPTLPASGSG